MTLSSAVVGPLDKEARGRVQLPRFGVDTSKEGASMAAFALLSLGCPLAAGHRGGLVPRGFGALLFLVLLLLLRPFCASSFCPRFCPCSCS